MLLIKKCIKRGICNLQHVKMELNFFLTYFAAQAKYSTKLTDTIIFRIPLGCFSLFGLIL